MGSIRSHLRFFPPGRGFNDATCSVYATTFLPLMIGVGIVPDFLVIGKTGGVDGIDMYSIYIYICYKKISIR